VIVATTDRHALARRAWILVAMPELR